MAATSLTLQLDESDKLAEGGHGAVYRAKVGDQVVAVKVFTSAGSDAARRELTAFRRLGTACPFIIKTFSAGAVNEIGTTALSMELGETDGFKAMQRAGKRGLGESRDLIALASQLGTSVHFCHMAGVAHRDIKPENILLVAAAGSPNLNGMVAKLCDFGAASIASAIPPQGQPLPPLMSSSTVGSSQYCAPEVLRLHAARTAVSRSGALPGTPAGKLLEAQRAVATLKYNTYAADVWSFAISLYVIGSRKVPFKSAVPSDYRFRGFVAATQAAAAKEPVFAAFLDCLGPLPAKERDFVWTWPSHFSQSLISLLSRCMRVDPAERPTITETLSHPWFTGVSLATWPIEVESGRTDTETVGSVVLPAVNSAGPGNVTAGGQQPVPPASAAGSGSAGGSHHPAGSDRESTHSSAGSSVVSGTSSILPFRQHVKGSLTPAVQRGPAAAAPAGPVAAWPAVDKPAPFLPLGKVSEEMTRTPGLALVSGESQDADLTTPRK